MKKFWILKGVVFVVAAVFVFGTVTVYLWNWLVPDLFHGPMISFWQAVGLVVLSRILFRGFSGKCGGHSWGRHHWRKHWQERWEKMTPEQKEEWRKKWGDRCGQWGAQEEPKAPTA